MQIAFEPPPLGLTRLDDPQLGRRQFGHLSAGLRRQPFVVQRQSSRRHDVFDQLVVGGQACPVGENRDGGAIPDQRRGGPTLTGDGCPFTRRIDEATVGQWICQFKGRVSKFFGKDFAHVAG